MGGQSFHNQPEQVRTRVGTKVKTRTRVKTRVKNRTSVGASVKPRAQCNVSERCSHTNDHWRALKGFDGL